MFKFLYKTSIRCLLFGILFGFISSIGFCQFLFLYFDYKNDILPSMSGLFFGYGFVTLLLRKHIKI